jgi:hypothetical protein
VGILFFPRLFHLNSLEEYSSERKSVMLEYAKRKFETIKNLEFEFIQINKKYDDKEDYLERYFITLYNYSVLGHFFNGKEKEYKKVGWTEVDPFNTDHSIAQIQKNIEMYNDLLKKYQKRINQLLKEKYYSNVSGFKNRIFKHLEPKQPPQQPPPNGGF